LEAGLQDDTHPSPADRRCDRLARQFSVSDGRTGQAITTPLLPDDSMTTWQTAIIFMEWKNAGQMPLSGKYAWRERLSDASLAC
jgi:hypothetical protein